MLYLVKSGGIAFMSSIRKQRQAQVDDALKKAGLAYKQGNYDEALKILHPFLPDETVKKAITKVLAAKQGATNLKPKPDVEALSKPKPATIQYILVTLLFCSGFYFLMVWAGNSGSNNPSNTIANTPITRYAEDYYTNADDVIVRTCANFGCESLVELPVGTRVTFIEALEGEASPVDGTTIWYHVRLSDDREGFINSRLLSEIRPTPAPTPIPPPVSRPSTNSNGSGNNTSQRPANCDEAVAMGLTAQQAAQWSHLDRDNDGVACYGD
jgi:hypothetical protein